MTLSVNPNPVYADTGTGIVSCFLTYNGTRVDGYNIHFRTYSEDSSNANITPAAESSSTSETGTSWMVYYNPNDYTGSSDTIYAVLLDADNDTVTSAWTQVEVHHPVWTMALSVNPNPVYADTGTGIVSCFLKADGQLVGDELISFRAASADSSNSSINSAAWSSTTSATGTEPTVSYFPNNYSGAVDTIYAVFESVPGDTSAWDTTVVHIVHP